jgi:hypothetical protein
MIVAELQFHAEMVAALEEGDTPDSVFHGIYFGEGDPEQGGQHWNFSRILNGDDGVCIVREIQEVTVYGGIVSCRLTHQSFACEFNDETAQETQARRLFITFEIDDQTWKSLATQARLVFHGENYFDLVL